MACSPQVEGLTSFSSGVKASDHGWEERKPEPQNIDICSKNTGWYTYPSGSRRDSCEEEHWWGPEAELRCYFLRWDGHSVVELDFGHSNVPYRKLGLSLWKANFCCIWPVYWQLHRDVKVEVDGGRTPGSSSDTPALGTTCSMVYNHM